MIRIRCLSFLACSVLASGMLYGQTVVVSVIDGNDDAEEHLTEGNSIDLTSTDLEIGAEGGGSDIQEIGIRFQNVNIPAGSIIQSASIQFTVDETDDEDTSVRIFGELAPNPVAYAANPGNISSRTKTSSFVDWNNIPLWDTVGAAGPDQQTPDLTSIVQEIIGQPGWAANNSLAFIISPNPGGERTAESFNGDPTAAPQLTVTYAPIPEPAALLLGCIGLAALALPRRRRC